MINKQMMHPRNFTKRTCHKCGWIIHITVEDCFIAKNPYNGTINEYHVGCYEIDGARGYDA